MRKKSFKISYLLLLFILLSFPNLTIQQKEDQYKQDQTKRKTELKMNFNVYKTPLYFIQNKGQVDEKALFYASASGYTLWVTKTGFVFEGIRKKKNTLLRKTPVYEREIFYLDIVGGEKAAKIIPIEKTGYSVDYLIGNDKSEWKTDIPTSKAVLYQEIYEGIDLKVYGKKAKIEYDWIISPEGNPEDICFVHRNIKGTYIDEQGDLIIKTSGGKLEHLKPVSYQVIAGKQVDIMCEFKEIEKDTYGFEIGEYDREHELIIDPLLLSYSTYLGGSDDEYGHAITVDDAGYVYVTGKTLSKDFPTENQYMTDPEDKNFDAFITKLDPTASGTSSLIFSTYFGGNSHDSGQGIAVDKSGHIYVTGYTYSTDFPMKNQYMNDPENNTWDAFLIKLDPNTSDGASLLYSSYFGGSDDDYSHGIALDGTGCAYITGFTQSTDYPTKNQYMSELGDKNFDGFVTKVNPALSGDASLIYSTYIGGNSHDRSYGIAVDDTGCIYVTGRTASRDFPTKNQYMSDPGDNKWDAFVAMLDPTRSGPASLLYSTYLGGEGRDKGQSIAVDNSGCAYVTGGTNSIDFPLIKYFMPDPGDNDYDVFIAKLNPALSGTSSLLYSTYLGGHDYDYGYGIAVDNFGCAHVTGFAWSNDFPFKNKLMRNSGNRETFIARLDPRLESTSSLLYSTYLGGSGEDYSQGIAIDKSGNTYVTGYTGSIDFPVKNQYMENPEDNKWDVFVTKISFLGSLSGKVIDKKTKEPVYNAKVKIISRSNPSIKDWTRTDKNGDYKLDNITLSFYKIKVRKIGYQPYKKNRKKIDRDDQFNIKLIQK